MQAAWPEQPLWISAFFRLGHLVTAAAAGPWMPLVEQIEELNSLKLRVVDSDGHDTPWFARTTFVKKAAATIRLPIAPNAQSGKWHVTVTDLYTDPSIEHSFTVQSLQNSSGGRIV